MSKEAEYSGIPQEMDIPPDTAETKLSKHEADELEKKVLIQKQIHPLLLKDRAFHLIIALLVALGVLYLADVLLKCRGIPNGELAVGLFEFLKVTVSTLIGFTFSIKNQDKE